MKELEDKINRRLEEKLVFEQDRPYYKYVSANLKTTINELTDYLFAELDLDESWIMP